MLPLPLTPVLLLFLLITGEQVKGKPVRGGAGPSVSVRKGGAIALNRPSTGAWFNQAPYAVLLFDADTGRAGFALYRKAGQNSCRIQYNKQGGAQINTRQFSEHYALKRDKSRTYEATWDDAAKAIVFTPEKEEM